MLAACDPIAEEDRLIYEAPPSVNRSVLIEDFTGQRCVNCPNAADEIHALQQEYGEDAVIAVGIHGGPMAVYPVPERGIVGLATETGDAYNDYWKVEQWPMGMVNRQGVTEFSKWKGTVRQELQKESPVAIMIDFDSKQMSKQAAAQIHVEGRKGATNGKLQVWVVEDSISAIQLMPDGTANAKYLHQHVFRAAVNGIWGEDISVTEGTTDKHSYTINMEDVWVKKNLSVVAFVHNDQGVIQVARQKLLEEIQQE